MTTYRRRRRRRRARHAASAAAAGLLAFVAACGTGTGPVQTYRAPAAPGSWHVVFNDEFTGSSLNTANWATCYDWNNHGCTNAGNHESQWYQPSQVAVGGGALTLNAVRQNTTGSDGKTYPWTSGMISTGRDHWDGNPRFTFTRGYVEAAVQVPDETGTFPAFWLMPASRTAPPEVDVAEFWDDPHNAQMTVHWTPPGGGDSYQQGSYGPEDYPAGFHVFALDWEANSLTWFVDGKPRFWVTDPQKIPNVPMEVLLDLAVGLPRQPPASLDAAQMRVDWVRVWQH